MTSSPDGDSEMGRSTFGVMSKSALRSASATRRLVQVAVGRLLVKFDATLDTSVEKEVAVVFVGIRSVTGGAGGGGGGDSPSSLTERSSVQL